MLHLKDSMTGLDEYENDVVKDLVVTSETLTTTTTTTTMAVAVRAQTKTIEYEIPIAKMKDP